MDLNVALLGFGNVGRALGDLLLAKADDMQEMYGLSVSVVGISTGSHGRAIDHDGLDLQAALDAVRAGGSIDDLHHGEPLETTHDFITACHADLMFESIPTNPQDGEPALSFSRSILRNSMHLVSANKGPVAFGYDELCALSAECGVGYFFESSVMDGAPVLTLGREGLPAARVQRIVGIFNSTTNYIITRMEQDGLNFDEALVAAQEIGIAETDPTLDIDGWDSAIKTVISANVLMGADLRPADVDRQGIRGLALSEIEAAAADGERIRLLCEAVRDGDTVRARVWPVHVPQGDVRASVTGTTSVVDFETDVLPRLTVLEHDPGPTTTAYGMLSDMINIARGRHRSDLKR